jgi:hypothetical protein
MTGAPAGAGPSQDSDRPTDSTLRRYGAFSTAVMKGTKSKPIRNRGIEKVFDARLAAHPLAG